jgi:hypothetical protein
MQPAIDGKFGHRNGRTGDAGAGDQDIDLPERMMGLSGGLGDGGMIGDVNGLRVHRAALPLGFSQRLVIDIP